MNKIGTSLFVALLAVPFLMVCSANAQDAAAASARELNIKAYVELLQTDVDSKREAIVKEIMQLGDSDAKVFWPVYKEYDAQRAKLDSAEAQLIQEYSTDYQTISNEKAEELLKKSFHTIKSALSATTAARFIEVENQMEDVASLQATSVLPANQANQ